MSVKTQCPICGRVFKGNEGVRAHASAKHPKHHVFPDGRAVLRCDLDDEPSMADLMIAAQLQQAIGEPVEDDWLLDAI
jgi:hypothetical protein